MRLAFCTEDHTDEVLLAAYAERIIGRAIIKETPDLQFPRGGFQRALLLAPLMARAVFRTECLGIIFAVDADDSTPHHPSHESSRAADCRHCQLRDAAEVEEVLGWPREPLGPLRFVFTVPVRTIETWLISGEEQPPRVHADQYGKTAPERRNLKRLAYGHEQPTSSVKQSVGLRRVAESQLDLLASRCTSFSWFRDELRRLPSP